MKQPFSWRKYLRYVLPGLAMIYGFKVLDTLIDNTSLVKRVERANLDALFSARSTEPSKEVFIVKITQDDYDQLFGGVSPLDPPKLIGIIQAVLDSGPKALGVDFDTSSWKGITKPSSSSTAIVWARETGGTAPADNVCYGVPAFVPNEDGFIRQYSEYVNGSDQTFPTLPVNLAEVFKKGPQGCRGPLPLGKWKETDDPPWINYAGDKSAFNRLTAGALLQLKGSSEDPEAARRWAAWKANNPLNGKLVLLGGGYHAARDTYPTPVGYIDGVDILAHTAQTRLSGHELNSQLHPGILNSWFNIQGYVFLLSLYFVPKALRMAVALLTGPIYAFLGNWLWFMAGGTFLSFVPYLVGIVVHQIYEHIKEFYEVEHENKKLKQELRDLGVKVPEHAAES